MRDALNCVAIYDGAVVQTDENRHLNARLHFLACLHFHDASHDAKVKLAPSAVRRTMSSGLHLLRPLVLRVSIYDRVKCIKNLDLEKVPDACTL